MEYPFDLTNHHSYATWRSRKLSFYPANQSLFTPIAHKDAPSTAEIAQLKATVRCYNLAFYRFKQQHTQTAPAATSDKAFVHQLATALGLHRVHANLCADADSLSSICVNQQEGQHEYIPYTNKPLSWHTDGYYYPPEETIHGMLLHCERSAVHGGENLFMDHEIAYILLRDENPAYIDALMHPEAFTIPANMLNGEVIRPKQSGPVFSVSAQGNLHMRYSARQRNIRWRNDDATQAAVQFLLKLWQQDSIYVIRHTLQAGEGVICNNVLHRRSAFQDPGNINNQRLLYRGRYLDRVAI